MIITGETGEADLAAARKISMELGHKFQIQDDYLDCYGDPEAIGKVGTDIMDHKCTWLVMKALQKVTKEQRQILENHYGKEEEEHQSKIK
eukprot:CAMPEP_0205831482 /NCGR_PEP_ID=MMETSP0206-20130828/44195_1 /ASSEMBLY_ACC=CAM_ASM_000279 /TAXON_ID=36767 /ORGANISM="Euplotes focardii, Strain TN1" /LENGTH=89 /DNA_ID=CAMNT_0053136165 /DNA_START=57 /DNA_END=323 /DNA_ORIENTATION=+